MDNTSFFDNKGITAPRQVGLLNDKEAYEQYKRSSTGPGEYSLNDRIYNNNCLMDYPGFFPRTGTSYDPSVEGELFNIGKPLTKSSSVPYKPFKNCNDCENCNNSIVCKCHHCSSDPHGYNINRCDNQISFELTREPKTYLDQVSKDIFGVASSDTDRMQSIQFNNIYGENTRVSVKDLLKKKRDLIKRFKK